jgi:hypothetical protein
MNLSKLKIIVPLVLTLCIFPTYSNGETKGKKHTLRQSIIFKTRAKPGTVNPCAFLLNHLLNKALQDKLHTSCAGRVIWQKQKMFFHWAMWGYFAGDSNYRGDKRLLKMSAKWLDQLFVILSTPPKDKKVKNWKANDLVGWNFHIYALPLIEAEHDPEAVAIIGKDRLKKLKTILIENLKSYNRKKIDKKLADNHNYINILMHMVPMFLTDLQLTGNKDADYFCSKSVEMLEKQQLPNGSYPYRFNFYGKRHSEPDSMYYHAVINRALYMYWWYTGNKTAFRVLKKSIPYYPLILEPPYHFSSGADIWWKDQWRTFWPQHVAMVAATTSNGENAGIALQMGENKKSIDWFDLVIGAHAYRLMAEKKVKPIAQRNNYIIKDPDIRGVRSRWNNWSNIFTAASFTFTRVSAMLTNGKNFDAMHLARPVFRTVQHPSKTPRFYRGRYANIDRFGTSFSVALKTDIAAIGTSYSQGLDWQVWGKTQKNSPWSTDELWLFLPTGACGIIKSTAKKDCKGFEILHQFRFICKNWHKVAGGWLAGNISFKVWSSSFKHTISERARRYAFNTSKRQDYQISLSDSNRSPEEVLQGADKKVEAIFPSEKQYKKDQSYYTLVSISPKGKEFKKVELITTKGLIAFSAIDSTGKKYLVIYNPGENIRVWNNSNNLKPLVSWKDVGDVKKLRIQPKGTVLFCW